MEEGRGWSGVGGKSWLENTKPSRDSEPGCTGVDTPTMQSFTSKQKLEEGRRGVVC